MFQEFLLPLSRALSYITTLSLNLSTTFFEFFKKVFLSLFNLSKVFVKRLILTKQPRSLDSYCSISAVFSKCKASKDHITITAQFISDFLINIWIFLLYLLFFASFKRFFPRSTLGRSYFS